MAYGKAAENKRLDHFEIFSTFNNADWEGTNPSEQINAELKKEGNFRRI